MFNLNKVKAFESNSTTALIAKVVKELGHMFDVLSKCIMTRYEITVVVGFYIFLMVMFWIGGIR